MNLFVIDGGKVGEDKFVPHTLKSTATFRGLIAILENRHAPDGGISVPKILRPYTGGQERLRGRSPR